MREGGRGKEGGGGKRKEEEKRRRKGRGNRGGKRERVKRWEEKVLTLRLSC